MFKQWRNLRVAGVAAVALYATLVACGDDGPGGDGGGNVELQVIAGIANAGGAYVVRVTTARGEQFMPLHTGDQTNPDNWTYFHLDLEEGEEITIAVAAEGSDLVSGYCTVQGATEEGWARAVVFYFAPPNNYVNCANGFIPAP